MRTPRLARTVVVLFALSLVLLSFGAPASALPLGGLGLGPGAGNWSLAGESCRLIETPTVRTATPVAVLGSCPGVRPGAIVESDAGQCTFNFVYAGTDGQTYMGTAGHCILGDDGETSWAPGSGPEARDGAGNRIGEFAYAVLEDPKDFSLIRVDAGVPVDPQMCHFGGPTGVNSDMPSGPVVLQHFGNGIGLGLVVPGRSAVALGMPDPDHVFAEGVVVPGDSGSGITSSDGRAVGVIVTTGIHIAGLGTSGIDAGLMGVTRLAPQLARATQVTGVGYSIVTAPPL
jgi:hypothetical protein